MLINSLNVSKPVRGRANGEGGSVSTVCECEDFIARQGEMCGIEPSRLETFASTDLPSVQAVPVHVASIMLTMQHSHVSFERLCMKTPDSTEIAGPGVHRANMYY